MELTNAAGRIQRDAGVPRGCPGAELHAGGRQAGRDPIGPRAIRSGRLEERLGIRLLSRTTRDVAPTAAGERLMESIAPHFESIAAEISALSALRDKPSGRIRIVCPDDAVEIVFRPRLPAFLRDYPDIDVELVADNGFTNIVERQFDAGVRLGEAVARDMVAVRIGPDVRYAVVGSPDYFARHGAPETPHDLTDHNCINLRFPTSGSVYTNGNSRRRPRVQRARRGSIDLQQHRCPRLMRLWTMSAWHTYRGSLSRPYLEGGQLQEVVSDWSPRSKAITSTIPAAATLRRPSPHSSKLSDTDPDRVAPGADLAMARIRFPAATSLPRKCVGPSRAKNGICKGKTQNVSSWQISLKKSAFRRAGTATKVALLKLSLR